MPNFLCIVTDQHRADHLGCAGNPVVRTPNIDRLAGCGIRFSQAYVNNPLCMPGRATMFTGRTPRGHGVRTNGIGLDRRIPTMPQALADAGYRTASVGKIHLRPFTIPTGADCADPLAEPETRYAWTEGGLRAMPTPYYGLQEVHFVGGHGVAWGDYDHWLAEQDKDAPRLRTREAGGPTRTGAEQAWKMALPEELHASKWIADRTIDFLSRQQGEYPAVLPVVLVPRPAPSLLPAGPLVRHVRSGRRAHARAAGRGTGLRCRRTFPRPPGGPPTVRPGQGDTDARRAAPGDPRPDLRHDLAGGSSHRPRARCAGAIRPAG